MKRSQLLSAEDNIDNRLQARLKEHRDNAPARVLVWADWRNERFTSRGLEGLKGPAASYHLGEAARYLNIAARELDTPAAALSTTICAYGNRYTRGLIALEDGLICAGVSVLRLEQFRSRRESFTAEFDPLLQAADVVCKLGLGRPVMVEVLHSFIAEIQSICEWLELSEERYRVPGILRHLEETVHVLNKPQEQTGGQGKRKRKRNKGELYFLGSSGMYGEDARG